MLKIVPAPTRALQASQLSDLSKRPNFLLRNVQFKSSEPISPAEPTLSMRQKLTHSPSEAAAEAVNSRNWAISRNSEDLAWRLASSRPWEAVGHQRSSLIFDFEGTLYCGGDGDSHQVRCYSNKDPRIFPYGLYAPRSRVRKTGIEKRKGGLGPTTVHTETNQQNITERLYPYLSHNLLRSSGAGEEKGSTPSQNSPRPLSTRGSAFSPGGS